MIAANATNAGLRDADAVQDGIERHVGNPDQQSGRDERDRHEEDVTANLAIAVRLLRTFIEERESVDRPFVRVVGRILYRLTVDGEREWCTLMPIAAVLLLRLREHLDPEHRQAGTNRDAIDTTESNLQALLYDRLNKLTGARPVMAQQSSTGHGYQLTEDGRFVFREWP